MQDLKAKIIKTIASEGSEGMTSTEIEKRVKLERHTLSKYLNILEKEGVLHYKQIGKGKLWYINKSPLQRINKNKNLTFTEKLICNVTSEIPVGIMVVDEDMKVLFQNSITQEVYGNIIGEKLFKCVLGPKNTPIQKRLLDIFGGKPGPIQFKTNDVEGRRLSIKASSLTNPDGSLSAILIVDDVTQDELSEQKLRDAYDRLKEIDQLKSRIMRDVASDLKQPVSLISMSVGLLIEEYRKDGLDKGKVLDYLNVLQRNSRIFESQLNSMMQLSRVESGDTILKEKTGISSIITEVVESARQRAKDKGLLLKADIDKVPGMTASGELIESMVKNLVSNAIRFTTEGHILVSCQAQGDNIAIKVSDTGAGISRKDQARLFEPFIKIDKESPGLGLGLALSKEIAILHGGRIAVTSEEGKGSVFTVLLPIEGE